MDGWNSIYCTFPTFDGEHSMTKVFEVDLPISLRIQVLGQLLHLWETEVSQVTYRQLASQIFIMDMVWLPLSQDSQLK